jgi:hypothetical protein
MTEDKAPPTDPRPFTGFIQEQRRGALHEELSEELQQLVHGVLEHGKAGTLTLQLKVKPAGDGMVTITDQIKTGVPQGERSPSIFYADDHGNVSRTDPRQMSMPMGAPLRAAQAGDAG